MSKLVKRSELLATVRALRENWPMSAEVWAKSAADAFAVLRSSEAYPRQVAAALRVFVEAARSSAFGIDTTINKLAEAKPTERDKDETQ